MKVTLVYAGITGTGFNNLGYSQAAGWISHGLAILSAVAKQQGFEVDLLDLRVLKGWDHFREEIISRQPAICGLTMMSVDFPQVMRCVEIIKAVDVDTVTVVGGPHPTLVTDEVAANQRIDYVVTGEGEIAFAHLLSAIEGGQSPEPRVIQGEPPDLDTLPFADRDLFPDEWRRCGYVVGSPEWPSFTELPAPFATIIAGRGCRYNCSFCQPAERRIFGKIVRRRSVENVIAELQYLRDRYGLASFMFHDDCLTEDQAWVTDFCRAYKAGGFTQPFFCQSRADIIVKREDMVRLMADAGLCGHIIGFESGSDRVLRFLRKGTTRAQNLAAARICKKHGLAIWANYMLGLPTETEDEIKETISMVKEIDPDYYSPTFYTPHPGSDLYDYCEKHDLSLIQKHEDYWRSNPYDARIKGHDPDFLRWALMESKRRKPINRLTRFASGGWKRYTSPRKAFRKARRLILGK